MTAQTVAISPDGVGNTTTVLPRAVYEQLMRDQAALNAIRERARHKLALWGLAIGSDFPFMPTFMTAVMQAVREIIGEDFP